jgi:spore maturation protein CgeB
MRILLIDTTLYEPSSPLFLDPVRESGSEYRFVDAAPYLRPLERSLVHKVAYRILRKRPLSYLAFNAALLAEARRFRPHLMMAVKGTYIMPAVLRAIKNETGALLVNYATDDPFNPAITTPSLLGGIPRYDLYACTKDAIMADVLRTGCPHAAYVRFAYKPSLHFPEAPSTPAEIRNFQSDVVLIGGADRDRLPFVEALIGMPGVSLALYGGYWTRHPHLRRYARGFATGRSYRLALGGARIALCLVRRANRDGHSMRSFEIPACGAFMLAERTDDHAALFHEDRHAAFFGSPEELRDKVQFYLAHDEVRETIARAGHVHVVAGGHTYHHRLAEIVRAAGFIGHPYSSTIAEAVADNSTGLPGAPIG